VTEDVVGHLSDAGAVPAGSTMGYKDPERQRTYQREWVAKNRADFLRGKVCKQCGSSDRLEVDHVNRATKIDHKVWSWSPKRRAKELAKCQILCHDCHQEKTSQEAAPPHGVNTRYTSPRWKCRCDACRKAHREVNALYR